MQNAGKNGIKIRAIKENVQTAMERLEAKTKEANEKLKAEAGKLMAEYLKQGACEKIPGDQVEDAMDQAREMQKKADEQREKEKTHPIKQNKPKGYDGRTPKQKRDNATSTARNKYNPR